MILEFGTRGIAKISEAAGLDFVLIDMEHSGLDRQSAGRPISLHRPRHGRRRYGGNGPNVTTPDQAREVVSAMRYAPAGQSGLGLGTTHNDYIVPAVPDYPHQANQSSVAICQIESTTGLENLDVIARTAGVNVLFVGHFDLTSSMGIVGEFDNSRFIEAIRRVANAARDAGEADSVISMGHDTP